MTQEETANALEPLEPLLLDPEVVEIMVDGPGRVLVQRGEKIADTGIVFPSVERLRAAIDAALALGGAGFEDGDTVCETQLPDGTRVLGVLPPTAIDGPYLVLRKFFTTAMTWEKLYAAGSISPEMHHLLQGAAAAGVNFLVSGGHGSGKTTLLNLLGEGLPPEDRLIVIGGADLPVKHPRRIHLAPGAQTRLSPTDLIATAARMRPDWILLGDLHGAEAIHLLQLLGVGFTGMASIHANSVQNALVRLESMCLLSNLGLGLAEIRQAIAYAFGVITCQRRYPDGRRRITEIVELSGIEHNRYLLQPLFRYDPELDRFERLPARASWE